MALSVFHRLRGFVCSRRASIAFGLGLLFSLTFLSSIFAITDITLFGPKRYERLKGKPTIYTDIFDGCASSDQGILRVQNGDGKKTRIKSARIYLNGVKVASEKEFKQKVPTFEKSVTLKKAINELKVVLKSGHHGYIKKLADYQEKRDGLGRQLERLQELKRTIEGPITAADLELVLRAVRDAKKGIEENEPRLDRVSHDLDDDADDGDDDTDDEPETDFDWAGRERSDLEKNRNEVQESLRRCEDARKDLDRTPKNKRNKDHEKKVEALKELARLLKDLDRAIEKTIDKLADIEEKIERIKKKGPSFLIIEVLGRDCDSTPPVISNPGPAEGGILNSSTPRISAQYADNPGGAGIDTEAVKLILDGNDVTAGASVTASGISYTPSTGLPDGGHSATVTVSDLAHNAASFTWHFTTDTIAPAVRIETPVAAAFLNTPGIAVTGTVSEPPASVTVNGQAAAVSGTSFSLAGLALTEGANTITVEARDAAGNAGTQSISVTLDTKPPVIAITAPAPDAYFNTPGITVTGTVDEAVTSVTVNGTPAELSGNNFIASGITLAEGGNTITVAALDRAGNTGTSSVTVILDTVPPVIQITTPAQDAYLNTPSIMVSGTMNEPVQSVAVNESAATVSGTGFSIAAVALAEGTNAITVSAVDRAGNRGSASVNVTLDTVPPAVTIAVPANGLLTNTPQITVSGTVNEPIIEVRVNGANAHIAETKAEWSISGVSLVEGANTIAVTVKDRAGNPGFTSVSVTLDSTAPQPPVLSASATATNAGTISVSGTAEPGSTINLYLTNGQGSQVLAGTGIADSRGAFSFPDIALADGNNAFTAAATDAAGNTSPLSGEIAVLFDTRPPVITVTAPANNSFTKQAQLLVSGSVDEQVTLEINGTSVTLQGLSFERALTLTEGINSLQITATDSAGNSSTKTVLITLDTVPPAVTISSPANGLLTNNPSVSVSGAVSETVASVSVNGTAAQVSGSTFTLAGFTLAEGQNAITAEAVDRAGNSASASVSVTLDSTPPAVTLSAPAQAAAGTMVNISLSASDTNSLSLCELTVNGAPVWSSNPQSAICNPQSVSFTLSPDLASGSVVDLLARVYDTAGNTGTATAQVQINGGPSGPGFIQGEVYDDSKGLRLEAATVTINSVSSVTSVAEISTLEDGGYFTEASAGDYVVTILKPGYTTVERIVTVRPEKKSVAIDARLTPMNQTQRLIDSAGGNIKTPLSVSSVASVANIELDVPAGAVNEPIDLRITPVSNQGLAGLLPQGWSPVAVVEIGRVMGQGSSSEGTTLNFAAPAVLKVPVSSGPNLAPSTHVSLVSYDTTTHAWIVQNPGVVSADGASITASIPSTGQHALVLPDTGSAALAAGQPLVSLDPGPLTPDPALFTASGRVVPPAAPPSIGLKAVGEVVLSSASSAVSSGTIINGRVTERFDLYSGDAVVPSEYVQDLVLYHYPCLTNLNPQSAIQNPQSAQTTFPVTPSREYTIAELMLGKVGIEISLPQQQETGVMVGADGGRLLDSDGNVLAIPAGALTGTAPVETKTVPVSILSNVVGSDFTLIRAVSLNLGGRTLSSSAELSVPAPVGVDSSLPLVVAKAIDVRGIQRLKLVALARVSGSLITSLATGPLPLAPGITTSGTYFFLQAKAPLGFVAGLVKDGSGNPYPAALTTSSTCSLADLTGIDGKYLIASTVSGFTATALDIYKNDEGSATGTITSASQTVTANLTIQITPPRIVSISPADNATGVEPNASIIIAFSEPVDKTTITSANIVLKDASNNTLSGVFSINPDSTVVTIYPGETLKSEAAYTIAISGSIRDLQGYVMGTEAVSRFTVKDTTPPPPPPAGSITGSFPDAEGYVTITATQGSAEPNNTVLIINDTSGEIVAVVPASNGSFTGRIQAMLGDEIKIVLMDQAGNQTLVSYITFKSADGKYLVTARGGIVEGEGGSRLVIPEGALSGPAVVKLTFVPEDRLPHPVQQPGQYLAAVNIDTGGVNFKKEVKLSVPAPPDLNPDTPVFVTQPRVQQNADGTTENVSVVLDSTKIVDGRITTASPPFDGIWVGGGLSFLAFPTMYPAIVSGWTYRDMNGNSLYDDGIDKPVKNAVIRTPGAWTYVSYSNSNGFYGGFTDVVNNPGTINPYGCKDYQVTAIHPQTMNRVTLTGFVCTPPYNLQRLNFKLAGPTDDIPDRMAPQIELAVKVGAEQDEAHQGVRFTAGAVPAGTNLEVSLAATDHSINTISLTPTYVSMDNATTAAYSNPLLTPSDSILVAPMTESSPAVYKTEYTPSFADPDIAGSAPQYFRPSRPGVYTLKVEAQDGSGNRSSKSMQVRVLDPNAPPVPGVDGPPTVDEIIPSDLAEEVMVTMPVTVVFSEPVTVNGDNFKLIDDETGLAVPGSVVADVAGGRMRAIFQPEHNLMFSRKYRVRLVTDPGQQGIIDTEPNPSFSDGLLPLKGYPDPVETTFTTKVPEVYDVTLDDSPDPFKNGKDIALYTDGATGRTYAYVITSGYGWRVVDVTDPTHPYIVSSNPWGKDVVQLRGVAVQQDRKIMAMTENIQFASGNQAGMIRFYDIGQNPAEPPIVGREHLAEAYSGIPGRLSLLGDMAYVSTVMAGLQAVSIDSALAPDPGDPGKAIKGVLDTGGMGYRQPNDIVTYRTSRGSYGLLTTSGGYLLTLDLNFPEMPQLMSPFKPEGFEAFRVAAVTDYAFTLDAACPASYAGGAEGSLKTADLAIAAGGYVNAGRMEVLDVTDPYSPQRIGTVKDQQGNAASIYPMDLVAGKTSGLVYATAGNTVYVIDIKNPCDPRLLNAITQAPLAGGATTDLGSSIALVEKDGWVYLASYDYGMRALDLDPVELGISDNDTEFPNVVLPARDYYPGVGTKAVTVWGIISGEPLDSSWELRVVEPINNFLIGGKLDATQKPIDGSPAIFKTVPGYREGFATLHIRWNGNDNIPLPDNFIIKLQAVKTNQSSLASEEYAFAFNVRHNGNVKLREVLAGTAVFVNDCKWDATTQTYICKSQGAYNQGDPEPERRFHFVQEMLNQVLFRKRGLDSPFNPGTPYADDLMDENGNYDGYAYNRLFAFKKNFKLKVNDTVGSYDPNAAAPYSTNDNTSAIFRKVMKDYLKRRNGSPWLIDNAPPQDGATWLHKIIDKDTLVGKEKRIPEIPLEWGATETERADFMQNADYQINNPSDTTMHNDSGLYELYKNVVEKFIKGMIIEAERYSGKDYNDPNFIRPKNEWTSRESYGPNGCTAPACVGQHGPGMSYCWFCKDTVESYNDNTTGVSACIPPSSTRTPGNVTYYTKKPDGTFDEHTGKIVQRTDVPNTYQGRLQAGTCAATGRQRYPGLYSWELVVYPEYYTAQDDATRQPNPQFNNAYWAGIDCSGLVTRSMQKSLRNISSGATYFVQMPPISNGSSLVQFNDWNNAALNWWTQAYARTADDLVQGEKLPAHQMDDSTATKKKLHQGDLVHYDGHISIVYSDKPTCTTTGTGTQNEQTSCTYEIIHASGTDELCYQPAGSTQTNCDFNRKVVINPINNEIQSNTLRNPTGFGRIKLWD